MGFNSGFKGLTFPAAKANLLHEKVNKEKGKLTPLGMCDLVESYIRFGGVCCLLLTGILAS